MMNSQNSKHEMRYVIFYIDFTNDVKVFYYPNQEDKIYLMDKEKETIFNDYNELVTYVDKEYHKKLKKKFKDNFSLSDTNRNLFLGQNQYNVDQIFNEVKQNFINKYNIDFNNDIQINTVINNYLKTADVNEFIVDAEIPLLLYSIDYIKSKYKTKKNLTLEILTAEEKNSFGEIFYTKVINFNGVKFNPILSIRYYFNELLYRNKWIKKDSEFDILMLKQFLDNDIAIIGKW